MVWFIDTIKGTEEKDPQVERSQRFMITKRYIAFGKVAALPPATILRAALAASFTLTPGNLKDTGDTTEQQANSNFPVTKFSSNFY